jgi:hypothetical protein
MFEDGPKKAQSSSGSKVTAPIPSIESSVLVRFSVSSVTHALSMAHSTLPGSEPFSCVNGPGGSEFSGPDDAGGVSVPMDNNRFSTTFRRSSIDERYLMGVRIGVNNTVAIEQH